jgi:hypothetical protein
VVAVSGIRLTRRRTVAAYEPVQPMQLAGATGDEALAKLERGLGEVADKINAAAGGSVYVADVDLIVGQNTIEHGLGRKPEMVYVMPASAVAAFGVGWDPSQPGNPRPTMIVQIAVAGVPMTARVEVR